jgi:thiol-disulfide isomerase/thioredoxin
MRRTIIRGMAAGVLMVASIACLAGEVAFSKPAFESAVAAGKPVIVDFAASWCPTCKAQKPIVDALLAEPKRKDVTLFKADYDRETALKKQLRVAQQSTFVVFKGGKEVARSTGETRPDALAALFDKAL